MDVNVVEAQSPLSAEFRAALKPSQGKAVDWRTDPDRPFTTNAMAAGIVAARGRHHRNRAIRSLLDPAQNNAFSFIARALADGASIRYAPANGTRGANYLVTNFDASKADAMAKGIVRPRGARVCIRRKRRRRSDTDRTCTSRRPA